MKGVTMTLMGVRMKRIPYGLLTSLAIFLVGATIQALVVPLFGSADEVGHMDYAYQLWHGQLPDFYQGIVMPGEGSGMIPVQWTSQHPPLFYAIFSPIVGPLVDANRLFLAGMICRFLNICIGAAVVVVVWWTARLLCSARAAVAGVAALVAASSPWLRGVSGAIYNDALSTLCAVLLIALTVKVLRFGATGKLLLLLGVLCCAAALTRLSLLVVIVVCMGAVVIEGWVRGKDRDRWGRWTSTYATLLAGLAVLGTSGWFYLRNFQLTGSVTGGHPEWSAEHLGRTATTVSSLMSKPENWAQLLGIFASSANSYDLVFWGLLVVPAVSAGIVFAMNCRAARYSLNRLSVPVLFLVISLLIIVMQFKYSAGGGGLIPRYTLPLISIFACVIAYGLTRFRELSVVLIVAWGSLVGVNFLQWSEQVLAEAEYRLPWFEVVSESLTGVYLALLVVAVIGLGLQQWRLSRGSARCNTQLTDAG